MVGPSSASLGDFFPALQIVKSNLTDLHYKIGSRQPIHHITLTQRPDPTESKISNALRFSSSTTAATLTATSHWEWTTRRQASAS